MAEPESFTSSYKSAKRQSHFNDALVKDFQGIGKSHGDN